MSDREKCGRLEVGRSEIHGRGLFATADIAAGEWIGTYAGPAVEEDGTHVLWVEQDDGDWIGYDGTNCLRFMNHSAAPNAEMDGVECYALRDIAGGEEITIDYGWDDA